MDAETGAMARIPRVGGHFYKLPTSAATATQRQNMKAGDQIPAFVKWAAKTIMAQYRKLVSDLSADLADCAAVS